jgi:hypothetical protein
VSDWFMTFREDDEQDDVAEPVGFGPPEDQLPGVVPVEVVLAQSPEVAVLLTGMRAFPDGIAMVLGVRLRRRARGAGTELFDDVFDHRDSDEPPDPAWQQGRLRWGFVLDGGAEVDNLGATADRMQLHGGGGGGHEQSCDRDFWLSALPPSGPLEVFCAWPRMGLPRMTQSLDVEPIVQAAARSRPLWT